jgi:hypothetical protein
VELGQIFLPARYPDVTDFLLLSAGVVAGVSARRMFQLERDSADAMRVESRARRFKGAGRQ